MAQYGLTSYWDERYKRDPDFFDWYQKWESLREFIRPHINTSQRFLIIGCGLSKLSEGMYDDGYTNQLNIDTSQIAIERMSQLYQDKPSMEFATMDATDLSAFENNTFDVAIDKGTLDSILCGESSATNVAKLLKEISRVLKDQGGQYICITYGQPSFRLPYLEPPSQTAIRISMLIIFTFVLGSGIHHIKHKTKVKTGGNIVLRKKPHTGKLMGTDPVKIHSLPIYEKVHIKVCASSANLGSGYDCIGIALNIYDELTVEKATEEQLVITGQYSSDVPHGRTNVIFWGMRIVYQLVHLISENSTIDQIREIVANLCKELESNRHRGKGFLTNVQNSLNHYTSTVLQCQQPTLPPFKYTYVKNIPVARGLGSSATAILLSLLAGFRIFKSSLNVPLNEDQQRDLIFLLACSIEGHGDNVAPSLYGGVQLVWVKHANCEMEEMFEEFNAQSDHHLSMATLPNQFCDDTTHSYPSIAHSHWKHREIMLQQSFSCIAFIPNIKVSTSQSRAHLPSYMKRKNCVFNLSRFGLLINALCTGQLHDLKEATQDSLHQAVRSTQYVPYLYPMIHAALQHGAYAAYLSGSGASILAFAPPIPGHDTESANSTYINDTPSHRISEAMMKIAKDFHVDGITLKTVIPHTAVDVL